MANYLYTTRANGIPYFERAEYRERWFPGSNEISRTIGCRWSDRRALIRAFLGYAEPFASGLTRSLPEFHPSADWMPCVSMSMISPEGYPTDDLGQLGFKFQSGEGLAVFQCVHANVPYRILADDEVVEGEWERNCIFTESYQTESQQVSGGAWKIVGSEPVEIIQEATTLPFFVKMVTIRWLATPTWDRARVESVLNRVNRTAFPNFYHANILFNYEPETLLMTGFEYEEQRTAAGDIVWNLNYHFMWRKQTWNRFFRRNGPGNQGPGYYSVVDRDSDLPPYADAEFRDLFDLSFGLSGGPLL